jgi:hypothetical protein
VNWRRARRFDVSTIVLDIIFPFGTMSTKADQVQPERSTANELIGHNDRDRVG